MTARAASRPIAARLREIAAATQGPTVAAVFDFDGTLIPGYSIFEFIGEQLRRREIGLGHVQRTAGTLAASLSGSIDDAELVTRGLAEWAGRTVEQMEALGARLFAQRLEGALFPEMRELIDAHRERGHTLVLATSATPFQVGAAARHIGIEHVLCTRLEIVDGRLTGRLDGPLLHGRAKAESVRHFAAERGLRLDDSFFYADGDEDEALMHLVGEPRPTNPKARLERVARRRGWPITRLASRGYTTPDAVIRNVAATASVVPLVASAAAVRALGGSRRDAANLLTSTLPRLTLELGGVRLNVVGEEHLRSHRPAVFIWNHRNIFDAQIVGRLVARDFGAVAKKELASSPLFRIASWFMPMAFIDRENHAAALEAIRPATQMLQDGWSILIAPEGTRARSGIGHFKKGAFRMAMDAKVPIVPIVVRNADEIGGRNARIPRPALVDVAVLPPVSMKGWTRANLTDRIAAVRQRFVDTLAHWPER